MKRNTPLPDRMKNIRLPDKAFLWIVAFAAFAVLCFILLFTLKPWILKLLFLLLGIGTAGYCWIMIESRRITLKPRQVVFPSVPSFDVLAAETRNETPEQIETADGAGEDPQPGEQDDHLVFISEKGDKYHLDRKCVGLRFADIVETLTEEKAVSLKRKPCSKCWPKAKKE
jgi:hypothetical protein